MLRRFLSTLLVAVGLLAPSNIFAVDEANRLELPQTIEVEKGATELQLPILLTNEEKMTGFQCDLYLPEGFTVATDEYDDYLIDIARTTTKRHSLATREMSDGALRIVLSSMTNATFSGNSGAVVNITLNIGENVGAGIHVVNLKNIVLTDPNASRYTSDDVSGNIVVKEAEQPVTITAKSLTMVYGDEVPTLTYTTEGAELVGTPALSCEATSTSPVGTYAIVVAKGTVENNQVTYVNGTLTITKAPLNIAAGNYTKKQGEENPEFTLTYTGFKNNETETVLTQQPSVTCAATASSTPGEYPVTVSGAEAQNYEITYTNGILVVTEPDHILVSDITLNESQISLSSIGSTVQLTAIVTPSNATDKSVTWNSQNSNVATVSANGLVTAVANGQTIISATTNDGSNLSAECAITVMIPSPTYITFADATVKALCVANWDTDGDGELSTDEAAAVTTLDRVFTNNTEITSFDELQFFTGLSTIGNFAFSGCSGLTSLIMPNSVVKLGTFDVFTGCTSLTSITISSNMETISSNCFKDCKALSRVTLTLNGQSVKQSGTTYKCYGQEMKSDNGLKSIFGDNVKQFILAEGTYVIPSFAFSGSQNLESVDIPEGVSRIDLSAFTKCPALRSLYIPSSVSSIDLAETDYNLSSLERIQVSTDNPYFDSRDNCNAFIHSEYNYLVLGCKNTVIPEGVCVIEDYAFSGCSNLASIVIPNSVFHIGRDAFASCKNLTDITIGSGVRSVGYQAFAACPQLADVYCYAENPPSASYSYLPSFNSQDIQNATLHVLSASLEAYQTTEPWSKFGTIVAIDQPTPKVTVETFTLNCARGYVGYNGSTLYGTSKENASVFAIIDYGNTNYLYDATHKNFVVHTVAAQAKTVGNLALESRTDLGKAVTGLTWGETGFPTYPWYLEDSFGNWLNMDSKPLVYMNTWKDFEGGNGGNTYRVEIVDTEYDATEALEILDNYFNPKSFVTYIFTEPGDVVTQTEPLPTTAGTVISEVPTELRKDYCNYELKPTTMKNGDNTVYVTVSYNLPFTASETYETATWYYARIRYNYYLCMDDTEPYFPTAVKQEEDRFQWAFMGTPHTGFVILNKAAGADKRLTKVGDYALMRESGTERWELIRNLAGFNLLRFGSELDYITQYGSNSGYLGFWVDTRGRTDDGGMWQLEDLATGIDSLEAEAEVGAYYRIDGRICEKRPTRPGIYIHCGKKVLIK